jgi:hypothetical protein
LAALSYEVDAAAGQLVAIAISQERQIPQLGMQDISLADGLNQSQRRELQRLGTDGDSGAGTNRQLARVNVERAAGAVDRESVPALLEP